MDIISLANYTAIVVYAGAWAYLIKEFLQQKAPQKVLVTVVSSVAIAIHFAGMYGTLFSDGLFYSGVFKLTSLFLWGMNALVLLSGLKKPLYNLFIFLFPLTAVSILLSEYSVSTKVSSSSDLLHILLAVLAIGFLSVATLQALLLAYQNRQLKHKHMTGAVTLLPPLQTMESLMFEMVWVGEVLLSLLILSGLIMTENISEQRQGHTLVLSILAWVVYAVLLWGRVRLGWRGTTAVRWTIGGFICLLLAYFGTQIVYQVILT